MEWLLMIIVVGFIIYTESKDEIKKILDEVEE